MTHGTEPKRATRVMNDHEVALRQSIVDNLSALVARRETKSYGRAVTDAIKQVAIGIAEGRY